MNVNIPITGFVPGERVAIDVIHRQAALFQAAPLPPQTLHSMINGVIVLNARRQILFASDNLRPFLAVDDAQGVLGLRPGEALGCVHAQEEPDGCGMSEACRVCGALRAILETLAGQHSMQECRLTRVLSCKDGPREESLDLLVAGTPLDIQGETFGLFSITDISHEKRRRALERTFFHDVHHAAGGVQGLIQILGRDAPPELRAELDALQANLRQLMDDVQSQRDLMAAETGELTVKRELLQSRDFLAGLLDFYRKLPVAKGRLLRLSPDCADAPVVTDAVLLQRILDRFIRNALEASAPEQPVVAGCEDRNQKVRFWVKNAGAMPVPVQLQVFNRSFTTREPGRGLGTYAAKLFAERCLQGKTGFFSSDAEGTCFFVDLPKG